MDVTKLIEDLSEFGTVQICKADYVFTLLMTVTGLTKMTTCNNIQICVLSYVEEKYPIIECTRNDETFYCMVLRPRDLP